MFVWRYLSLKALHEFLEEKVFGFKTCDRYGTVKPAYDYYEQSFVMYS